ncbi:MAG: hypothetical protein Q4C59_09185, partial [Lachnospiraceae bacterium]|nr:hypothetical protein [Lachnospiraceae bacterium]
LESAIKSVKNGDTIVLKKNVSYTKPLTISRSGKSFTINLNKKTITFQNAKSYLSVKKGTVILKNGTLVQKADKAYIIKTAKDTKLTVDSGTYKELITNIGTMTIKNGTFTNIGKTTTLDYATINNKGTMTINGGTINGKKMQAVSNQGKMTINGGTFKTAIPFGEGLEDPNIPEQQPDTLIYNYGKGRLTINGGKFTSTVLSLLNTEKAAVTVNKGKASFTSQLVGCFTNFGIANVKGGTWTTKEEGWGVFYNWGPMSVSNVTVKSNWSVLESYDSTILKVQSGKFTSACNGDPAMIIAFGESSIRVNAGTFTGKRTWGCWKDEGAAIKLSNAVKMTVKDVNKTGNLFWD